MKCPALLEAEIFCAFQQKAQRGETGGAAPGELFGKFLADVEPGRIVLFPLGGDVIEESLYVARLCFANQPPVPLRTLGGIHLATALLLSCERVLSTDDRMKAAAKVLGLVAVK
ncbi:MAG: hypothetical protein KA152_05370 [Verrucomicrobiales bacterium]|nr:hypothetical protein [Verrucomicrobiales bacterium]